MNNVEELRDFMSSCLSLNEKILELAEEEKNDEVWISVMFHHITGILKSKTDPRAAYDQFKKNLEEEMEVTDA